METQATPATAPVLSSIPAMPEPPPPPAVEEEVEEERTMVKA